MSKALELAAHLEAFALNFKDRKAAAELRRLDAALVIVDGELAECKAAYESQFKELHALKAQRDANAQLIAAAPELLAALISIKKRLEECSKVSEISARDAYDSFYQEVVNDAIAKATGPEGGAQ